MKRNLSSLIVLFAASANLRATPVQPAAGKALEQLKGASIENAGPNGAQWADGSANKPTLAVDAPGQNAAKTAPAAAPAAASSPAKPVPAPEVSASRIGSNASDGAAVGFMAGFLAVESPAIALSQIPLIGWLVGGVAAAILFIPAVIVGGVGALVGSFF